MSMVRHCAAASELRLLLISFCFPVLIQRRELYLLREPVRVRKSASALDEDAAMTRADSVGEGIWIIPFGTAPFQLDG